MKNEEGAEVNSFREVGGKRTLCFYESHEEMEFLLEKKKGRKKSVVRIVDLKGRIYNDW